MAVVTGLTKERMEEIEAASVVSGQVVGDNLILTKFGGSQINAGNVRGPIGLSGGAFQQCTSTTRPTYGSGDGGKAIFETNTKLIRVWTGTVWRTQEQVSCTSTTRPTPLSTDAGLRITETDTRLEYMWTGTAFFPLGTAPPTFANASARSSAWPSPSNGSLSYLTDAPGILWVYASGVWNSSGGPPGLYFPCILDTPPLCHVFMFGQSISNASTLYPVLWANVPSTWKSGTSLLVPDMRGRVPVGLDNMGGSDAGRLSVANTLGGTGGAQTHSLALAENAQHNHNVTDPGHWHGMYGGAWANGSTYHVINDDYVSGGNSPHYFDLASGTQTAQTGISIGNSGSGSPHNNMQPYILMNWALKIL